MSNEKNRGIHVVSSPDEGGFVALSIPANIAATLPPEAKAFLIRFRTPEGFMEFMSQMMDGAVATWPAMKEMWDAVPADDAPAGIFAKFKKGT